LPHVSGSVDICREGLHVGEVLVGQNGAGGVARRACESRVGGIGPHHPAVVDIDVLVAEIRHAGPDHGVRRLAKQFVADAVVVRVPMVPAHGRRQRERVAGDNPELASRGSALVPGPQRDGELAALPRRRPGDDAGVAVESEAARQALGGEPHGPLARARNAVKERSPRTAPVDTGAVQAGRRPRRRRQHLRRGRRYRETESDERRGDAET